MPAVPSSAEPVTPVSSEAEPQARGWHESSWDLRIGLEVMEHHWDPEAVELAAASGW